MTHTPGPWTFNTDFDEVQAETGTKTIALVSVHKGEFMDDDEVNANARLIAAAPDLLAALKRIARDVLSDSPEMWREVFAAIEKAEP